MQLQYGGKNQTYNNILILQWPPWAIKQTADL